MLVDPTGENFASFLLKFPPMNYGWSGISFVSFDIQNV